MSRIPWPARWGIYSRPSIVRHALGAAQSFNVGDLLTTSIGTAVEATGLDPTNLLGIAQEGADGVIEPEFVMVYEFNTTDWIGMMGSRDPVAGDVDTDYGIVQDSDGNWTVDITDVVNTRVTVKAVDLVQNYYFVSVLSAHIQS